MRYRTELQLIDATNEKWDIYKSLEIKIASLAQKYGITVISSSYDNETFVKTLYLDKGNDLDERNLILKMGNLLGSHSLETVVISYVEVIPNNNKIKYTIELLSPTQERWSLFKSAELQIKEHADEEKVRLEDIKYNDKDYIVSMVASYNSEIARSNLDSKMVLCLKLLGLEVKYLDVTEVKNYSNEVRDLSLYNLNKLMDKAEESLEKLCSR